MSDIFVSSVRGLTVALALIAFGCDDDGDGDSGVPSDGAAGLDAGATDGGAPGDDAGPGDAGPGGADAGRPDAGPGPCGSLGLPALTAEDVAPGTSWDAPIFITQPPGSDDLYVAEQPGRVRRIAPDGTVSEFVDISDDVDYGGERGLLGLAFHPDYVSNGRFFLYYTPQGGPFDDHNHVGEFQRMGGAEVGDPNEVRSIWTIDDPEGNHNGGMIAFGPDGFLYVGTGDGGSGGDPHGPIGNGLNTDTTLGKILRLDVDLDAPDNGAASNPFVGVEGDDRIWAYGIRNPWRFSFDVLTGDLYIGDVGQNEWEEIDFQPASSVGGENYGWRAYEGFEVFRDADTDEVDVHTEPVVVYGRSGAPISGRSVTGGNVYRGSSIDGLGGWYFFADFVSGDVAAFAMCDGEAMGLQAVPGLSGGNISSFGNDDDGELYIVGFNFVRRVTAAP